MNIQIEAVTGILQLIKEMMLKQEAFAISRGLKIFEYAVEYSVIKKEILGVFYEVEFFIRVCVNAVTN